MTHVDVTPLRALAWAVLSFAAFCTALFVTFGVITVVRWFVELDHLVELALWSLVWGSLALAAVLGAARVAFGAWPAVRPAGILLAAGGIALSGTVHVLLQQWEIERFGYRDPDLVGWTAGLFAVLLGQATAAFGVFAAPRGAVGWPLAGVLLGAAGIALIVAANLPGLRDGIAPESWPLAVAVAACALYAVFATGASIIRARRLRATFER
ncbi:MAG TPA: hypothetical protein VF013_09010 [Candidatus Limnocylindria bacterium]